jgi:hypothetical protein
LGDKIRSGAALRPEIQDLGIPVVVGDRSHRITLWGQPERLGSGGTHYIYVRTLPWLALSQLQGRS